MQVLLERSSVPMSASGSGSSQHAQTDTGEAKRDRGFSKINDGLCVICNRGTYTKPTPERKWTCNYAWCVRSAFEVVPGKVDHS